MKLKSEEAARRHGLAGAIVLRGTLGYGTSNPIHTSKILRLSEDLGHPLRSSQ